MGKPRTTVLNANAEFWKMIEERRKEKTVPISEARRQLEARWAKGGRPSKAKRTLRKKKS